MVSIVMATHQGEAYLKVQLDSILEGTRPPDELVIVDDASTDGTLAILEQYASGPWGDRIRMIGRTTVQGATLSFLEGVEHTQGDVVFFADQDDRWAAEKVAKVMSVLTEHPGTIMVYHDGIICDANLRPDGRTIFGTRKRARLELGALRDPMEICGNPDVKGCTMAMDGRFLRELTARTDRAIASYWGHDHWAALFAYSTGKVIAIPDKLIQHRFHGRNASSATGFNPSSPRHWLRNVRMARKQRPDHFVQRYRIALEHMVQEGGIRKSLRTHLELATQRHELRARPFMERVAGIMKTYREGIYDLHYNGLSTALRDLFSG